MNIEMSISIMLLVSKSDTFQHGIKHQGSYLGKNHVHWTATCKVLVPCFMSRHKISQKCSIHTKSLFLSNCVHKFVYIPVSERFSFAKIIHPPVSCGISINWWLHMIITQVHLMLGTIKGCSKICSFVTQHNATDLSSFDRACNWQADCRNVHFSTISVLVNLAVCTAGLTTADHVYGVVWWAVCWCQHCEHGNTVMRSWWPLWGLSYLWTTDAYLYSQSCEIHRLGPNELNWLITL